ncbi:MAG: M10 family metallopeptidase domain-containing protein [Proteobacteria bacterium]|jgi:hypothetical protein|nr:M10 family metallopeptidase domain-containing protein [Pseudomonadota bacterium]
MQRYSPNSITFLAAAGALLLGSANAFGYSYFESPDGDPVRWMEPRVTVVLDGSLSRLGEVHEIQDSIKDAFGVWADSVDFPFEFEFVEGDCGAGGVKADGVSCILVESAAPDGKDDANATTYVSYGASNGAIVGADIVFYQSAGPWSADGSDDTQDVFAVASHEAGHMLGLGHSEVVEARMYPTIAQGGQWDGDLDEDDIDGAEALYEGVELDDEAGTMSCTASVAPGRPGSMSPVLAMLLVLGLVYVRRARP